MDSIFNPHSVQDLARELRSAILRRWSIPAIEPVDEDYLRPDGSDAFFVDSFGARYLVTVTPVSERA